ncbi:MAG: ABC transporter permease [candidate division Zixibacteria bacterium]|nr:ABC transporter permease [candidate division Zixibacteria bacterium]
MITYIKLAWRNMFRNKRRTFIAGTAIGIGLAAMILSDAFMIGMNDNLIKSATQSFLGEAQIHQKEFRDTFEVEKTINDLEAVSNNLKNDSIVEHFTVRTMAIAMISSPANVAAVSMVGINPETEEYLSQIDEALIEGEYFSGESKYDVVIGYKLAELIEVELGDRVVLTTAQAKTGELSQEMFRISGIFKFNAADMDRGMAYIHLNRAQKMLGLENQAHQIAIKFTDINMAQNKNLYFWEKFTVNDNEAVGWPVILPQLDAIFYLSDYSLGIMAVILFGIISMGIVNTLFMSLHERMFEFGVMRAVGTRPMKMGLMILYEAGSLAVIASIIGSILGFVAVSLIAINGIDYTGIEYAGTTFRDPLYPVLSVMQFITYPFLFFIFTMITALIPAWSAVKMKPAEAMRKSF